MEKLGLVPILSWRENLSGRVTKAKVTSVEERREKKKISAKKRGCEKDTNRGRGVVEWQQAPLPGCRKHKSGPLQCSQVQCAAVRVPVHVQEHVPSTRRS